MMITIGEHIRNNHVTRWLCRHLTEHGGVFSVGGNRKSGKICLCGTYIRFDDEVEE